MLAVRRGAQGRVAATRGGTIERLFGKVVKPFIDTNRFSDSFGPGWISRRAARRIKKFLDSFDEATLRSLIKDDDDIVSLLPPHIIAAWEEEAEPYRPFASHIDKEKVWELLDGKAKEMILSYPEGEVWARRQMSSLMRLFFGGV